LIVRNSIFRNSFWYGLESAIESVVTLALSVIVARAMGPVALGYLIYFMFLTNLAFRFSATGPGAATRKFLAEYLGRDDRATARAVFFTMLRWHVRLGLAFAAVGSALVFAFVEQSQRLVALLVVASMIASIVNNVSSMANMAAENFARNVPASVFSLGLYAIAVLLTLTLHLGVAGLAGAFLLRRTVEMLMRLAPALRWARHLPVAPAPAHLARTMLRFSGQGLAVAGLAMIVWDRSELLFLRHFCRIQEVTFYSVAFSVTETLLMLPNVIGAAVSSRLMAEYARSRSNFGTLASSSIRYIALLVAPMYIGLAAMSDTVVRSFYGPSYLPAIPVLMISLILSVPKAFSWFPNATLQSANRQGVMFRWMLVFAALNLVLDALLIPRFGAIGAALGNGLAQTIALTILAVTAVRVFDGRLPWGSLGLTFGSAVAMGVIVNLALHYLHPVAGLVCGPILGFFVYLGLLRITGAFTGDDLSFVRQFESRVPLRLRGACRWVLLWLAGTSGNAGSRPIELLPSEAEVRN
jgi:O-antigen/teichoic acid export membrane protein